MRIGWGGGFAQVAVEGALEARLVQWRGGRSCSHSGGGAALGLEGGEVLQGGAEAAIHGGFVAEEGRRAG
jgi:hypothetical protein